MGVDARKVRTLLVSQNGAQKFVMPVEPLDDYSRMSTADMQHFFHTLQSAWDGQLVAPGKGAQLTVTHAGISTVVDHGSCLAVLLLGPIREARQSRYLSWTNEGEGEATVHLGVAKAPTAPKPKGGKAKSNKVKKGQIEVSCCTSQP